MLADASAESKDDFLMVVSNSSNPNSGIYQKCGEAITLLSRRLRSPSRPENFDAMFAEFEEYRGAYQQYTERPLSEARVYEIGYGARPWRLIALASMGVDVRGIDLDRPMIGFSFADLARVWEQNGIERALKSGVRSLFFDGGDLRALRAALEQRGYSMRVDVARFNVGSAATHDYGTRAIDFVYSDDVFEHIPLAELEDTMARLAQKISPNGLLLITPNIFTGITGGHLLEWYSHVVVSETRRRSEPWEHLRKRRFRANTYLNGLPRSTYRDIFGRYFQIVEERVLHPDLGRKWLTPDVRSDLERWPDEELFSNQVRFILRPKK